MATVEDDTRTDEPETEAVTDPVEMGHEFIEALAQKKHDFRGDGDTCAICGKDATDEIHYGQSAAAAPVAAAGKGWKANPLFFMDQQTRDGRILASASADAKGAFWTDTPKTLMAQFQNPEQGGGHALAVVAGSMPGTDITMKGKRVLAAGRFNDDENGSKAAEYVNNGSLTGISVDLAPQKWEIEIAPQDGGGILFFSKDKDEPDEPIVISESVDDVLLRFTEYEVVGGTLVPTPAFGDAQVSMTADADGRMSRVANPGYGRVYVHMRTTENGWPVPVKVTVGGMITPEDEAITAAAPFPIDSVGEFHMLVEALDTAKLAGLMTPEQAAQVFSRVIRGRL